MWLYVSRKTFLEEITRIPRILTLLKQNIDLLIIISARYFVFIQKSQISADRFALDASASVEISKDMLVCHQNRNNNYDSNGITCPNRMVFLSLHFHKFF